MEITIEADVSINGKKVFALFNLLFLIEANLSRLLAANKSVIPHETKNLSDLPFHFLFFRSFHLFFLFFLLFFSLSFYLFPFIHYFILFSFFRIFPLISSDFLSYLLSLYHFFSFFFTPFLIFFSFHESRKYLLKEDKKCQN